MRDVLSTEAQKNGLTLTEYLQGLTDKGMTLAAIAEVWGVSRQAISLVAIAEGIHFDNFKAKLDTASKNLGYDSFEKLIEEMGGQWTQEDIAQQLGVSLSTVVRRIKKIKKTEKAKSEVKSETEPLEKAAAFDGPELRWCGCGDALSKDDVRCATCSMFEPPKQLQEPST